MAYGMYATVGSTVTPDTHLQSHAACGMRSWPHGLPSAILAVLTLQSSCHRSLVDISFFLAWFPAKLDAPQHLCHDFSVDMYLSLLVLVISSERLAILFSGG